jgi:hypothetical protein
MVVTPPRLDVIVVTKTRGPVCASEKVEKTVSEGLLPGERIVET